MKTLKSYFLLWFLSFTTSLLLATPTTKYLDNPDTGKHPFFDLYNVVDFNDYSTQLNRIHTRIKMLDAVDKNWSFQTTADIKTQDKSTTSNTLITRKLQNLSVPKIAFTQTPLNHVIHSLSELSCKLDQEGESINFVLIQAQEDPPNVSIHLKNVTLEKALKHITKSVGYSYHIEDDIVIIEPSAFPYTDLQTEVFPISRATVIRLTSMHEQAFGKRSAGLPAMQEEPALKKFFQKAGVDFENTPGSNLAFEGTYLFVTQTSANLDRVSNILNRYKEAKQVEIEAKFLEVQEGALEELGIRWNVAKKRSSFSTGSGSNDNLRNLSEAFATQSFSSGNGQIVTNGTTTTITNTAPNIPNAINLATEGVSVGNLIGFIGDFDMNVLLRALEQHGGSDLMSAPKLTVLSGKTAEIVVAQELRYPQSFGDIRSEVGTSDRNGNVGSGVSITAGTPKDFAVRNIGVEMEVTPTVEDNNSISLRLEPQVTEFEGFVEYGGNSVALSGNTTVNVPSGFFQPIFSTRKIRTEVTIQDGATVVMGGLTREEAKQVHDKVPLLGSLPFIGRLFQSKGETNQKRNLLIFVTASLISNEGVSQETIANRPSNTRPMLEQKPTSSITKKMILSKEPKRHKNHS